MYLPDIEDDNGQKRVLPNRRYLFTIINTVYPNSVEEMIKVTIRTRSQLRVHFDDKAEKLVHVNEALAKLILASHHVPGKFFY